MIDLPGLDLPWRRLPAPLPMWQGQAHPGAWRDFAAAARAGGGRLVALWGTPGAICAAYGLREGLAWLQLPLAEGQAYPDLSPTFPAAGRMQRAAADLLGLHADGGDHRPWLDHGVWPVPHPPLQPGPLPLATGPTPLPPPYPFVVVEGDGVHEIGVGPVHAGVIEPGHFRFSIVGEKVLRLEERLGYTHKGIERRFTEMPALQAHRLAGRVCGDSTVAFAWAYCMALESACGATLPQRAQGLRALLLERERIANHLGDLGALGNDAGLGFGLAQFSRLREDWLRQSQGVYGHRLMMDAVVPGGVAVAPTAAQLDDTRRMADAIEAEVRALREVYDEHAGLQDRFLTAGRVTPALAAQLGLTGLAGRASGVPADLRCDQPWPPYDRLGVRRATRTNGDVAARVSVRFDEAIESLRLVRDLCGDLGTGATQVDLAPPRGPALGAGWVEGWRGEVFVALELDSAGAIRRCHCHDPSWQNWPVLEHAIIGNIVPDFPLINKSFNLSYSGHDL